MSDAERFARMDVYELMRFIETEQLVTRWGEDRQERQLTLPLPELRHPAADCHAGEDPTVAEANES